MSEIEIRMDEPGYLLFMAGSLDFVSLIISGNVQGKHWSGHRN